MISQSILDIRSKALRCRELAEAASDAEVAEELRRIAADIEDAIVVLGTQCPDDVSSSVAL